MHESFQIGAFFTPAAWAEFAIRRYNLCEKWLSGKSVLDPSMGEAALLSTMIDIGNSYAGDLPYDSLYGFEIQAEFHSKAIDCLTEHSGRSCKSDNFILDDFLLTESGIKADIIFGNPPWLNYNNIPGSYKEKIRPKFIEYGLARQGKALLLGGSRIELAALFVLKSIKYHLNYGGEAVFFLPLSIFHNEGANKYFRSFRIDDTSFKILEIIDLTNAYVFSGVSTHYGLVHIRRDEKTSFPIPYYRYINGELHEYKAEPLHGSCSPLCVLETDKESPLKGFIPIEINSCSVPRQGINTCGANDVFFFAAQVQNGDSDGSPDSKPPGVPDRFFYPLITKENFRSIEPEKVYRKVLLPYEKSGRIIQPAELQKYKSLYSYLLIHRERLEHRKGRIICSQIKLSHWYALLGVGPYSFFPWKVVWEAYGRNLFEPKIFPGRWQANQALQGFIPCKSLKEAKAVLNRLQEPAVQNYLSCHSMEGTMNWAQPGKIRKLLSICDTPTDTRLLNKADL